MSSSTNNKTDFRSWALYPWFEEHGASYIHPEDLEHFKQLPLGPKVFGVLGDVEDFTKIAYGPEVFRVKPSLLQPVAAPKFTIGNKVHVAGKDDEAVIEQVLWHHKENRPFFIVRVGGKLKSKRYWEEDLVEAS